MYEKIDKFKSDSKSSKSPTTNPNYSNSVHSFSLPPCDIDPFGARGLEIYNAFTI
ncbi:hypothetical protein FF38_02618 [Lucilia cuprina]|uniref:Uncharacterized protein n=1 Tax=Lucilia cuprina TaxID=7375 RepID=A0A0L0BMT3_LUCCU|nr:hypothetical protein FF38_02618 [Lucilia cuprina]